MLNIVCQRLHLDAVLVICSVFASQNYNKTQHITCNGNMHELCNETPFMNVNKLNSFLCTVYGAYKDFEERLYCFLC